MAPRAVARSRCARQAGRTDDNPTNGVTMQDTETRLDCRRSVNDTIADYPETLAVFDLFGVDSCCGGGLSVEDAASRASLDATALCAALEEAVRQARG